MTRIGTLGLNTNTFAKNNKTVDKIATRIIDEIHLAQSSQRLPGQVC